MSASFEILLDGASGPTSRLGQFRTRAGCKLRRCFFIFQRLACSPKRKPGGGGPGWAACTTVGISLRQVTEFGKHITFLNYMWFRLPVGRPTSEERVCGDLGDSSCRHRAGLAGQTPRFSEIAKSTNLHGRIKDVTIPKIQNFHEFLNFRNDGRAICVSKVPCRNMTFRFGRHQPGRSNSENPENIPISEFSECTWPSHRRHNSDNSEI